MKTISKALIVVICAIAISAGCTKEKIIEVEKIVRDTVFQVKNGDTVKVLNTDTIYTTKYDTIYTTKYDTIYTTKYDTIYTTKYDTVVFENKVYILPFGLPEDAKQFVINNSDKIKSKAQECYDDVTDPYHLKKEHMTVVAYWTKDGVYPDKFSNKLMFVLYHETLKEALDHYSKIILKPIYYSLYEQDFTYLHSRFDELGFGGMDKFYPKHLSEHSYVLGTFTYKSLQ